MLKKKPIIKKENHVVNALKLITAISPFDDDLEVAKGKLQRLGMDPDKITTEKMPAIINKLNELKNK